MGHPPCASLAGTLRSGTDQVAIGPFNSVREDVVMGDPKSLDRDDSGIGLKSRTIDCQGHGKHQDAWRKPSARSGARGVDLGLT